MNKILFHFNVETICIAVNYYLVGAGGQELVALAISLDLRLRAHKQYLRTGIASQFRAGGLDVKIQSNYEMRNMIKVP